MASTAFALEGVSKSYDVWRRLRGTRVTAIREVSLEVPRGIIFGLLGLNGAGKTTTMKLLVGLARPERGTVRVLGGDPAEPSVRARLGYLPELPYLPRQPCARDLLALYARMSGLAGRHLGNQVGRALALTALTARARDPVGLFSKGQLQRLAVAQALLHGPAILFLDEPMSGLDPQGVKDMRDLMLHLRAEGVSVCVNSHQIAEVERVCDRVAVMAGGRVVAEGAVGALLATAPLRRYRVTLLSPGPSVSWGIEDLEVDEHDLAACLAAQRARGARVLQILAKEGSLEDVMLSLATRTAGALAA